jgi:hypothetical protein
MVKKHIWEVTDVARRMYNSFGGRTVNQFGEITGYNENVGIIFEFTQDRWTWVNR